MFDMRRYAEIQEHGIRRGGNMNLDPKGFCAVQAYMYCTHDKVTNDISFKGYNPYTSTLSHYREIIRFNDRGTNEDRQWLVSILPQLENFPSLFLERQNGLLPEVRKPELLFL